MRHESCVLSLESCVLSLHLSMKLTSPDFDQNEPIPAQFTCDGADTAPTLRISGVPETAKTVALIMDDPDATTGTWTHWTIWNIPAAESLVIEGGLPAEAVEGVTSSGQTGYGGPCPPSGMHRYFFKAFALDAALDLPSESGAADLERAMQGHILDKCGLIGVYGRQ